MKLVYPMKKIVLYSLFVFICNALSAQTIINYCAAAPRYDTEVFSSVTKTTDVVYGANIDHQGSNYILKMDVYEPTGDTVSIRPLIVFAHGGSFVGGDKSNSDQVNLCTHFAKRGYVTATINYRLGISFPLDSNNATRAVYRAVQDMKASVRNFRKDAATTNTYRIDPSVIFVGGSSAGAFTALHMAYLDQYPELPSAIDTSLLGNIEGNSGNPGYVSTANAVINLCGALGKKQWMQPGDIPLVSMHGTSDNVVPYSTATLYLLGIFPITVVDGSYAINRHADSIGVNNEMYTYFGGSHVPYDGGSAGNMAYLDTTLRFVSNFLFTYLGCTPSDPNPLPNTFTPTAIVDITPQSGIVIYPNPANDLINIRINENINHLSLFSIDGKTVYHTKEINSSSFTIPVSNLTKGLYLLKLNTAHSTILRKVVIDN